MEVADCIIWAQEDGIVIEGSLLKDAKNSSKAWVLKELGGEHFIIHTTDEKTQGASKTELFAARIGKHISVFGRSSNSLSAFLLLSKLQHRCS